MSLSISDDGSVILYNPQLSNAVESIYFNLFPRFDMHVNVVFNENTFADITERFASSETDKSVMIFDNCCAYVLLLNENELIEFPELIV